MFKKYYTLSFQKNNRNACLCLSSAQQVIRKWHGLFAELVFTRINIQHYNDTTSNSIDLDKKQVHEFFVDMTCLHQNIMCYYQIDKDLNNHQFPQENFNIAKSLLLQIRMHDQHPCREALMNYYLNEFDDFDDTLFDQTLSLMTKKNMIQSIITEDGGQYFDKNPQPHDHIYFKHHQKLVDCPSEISYILNNLPIYDKKPSNQGHVYYVNNPLN